MNKAEYLHSRHAGNAGDTIKHRILVNMLSAMVKVHAGPVHYIETHAGWGIYDLEKAGNDEWRDGIGSLLQRRLDDPETNHVRLVKELNREFGENHLRYYPGSPWLAVNLLREKDSVSLVDHSSAAVDSLAALFREERVTVYQADGYELVGRLVAREDYSVILIDPPYKVDVEVHRVKQAVDSLLSGNASVTVLIWYPDKKIQKFLETGSCRVMADEKSGTGVILLGKHRDLLS